MSEDATDQANLDFAFIRSPLHRGPLVEAVLNGIFLSN